MNWKETPKESCEKFAGHIFLKQLRKSGQSLSDYATEQKDRNHIIWQRNPLAILLTNRVMAGGKIEDMHYNPAQHRWQLYQDPMEYRFSSARFYETGEDVFKILTHYMEKL